MCLADPNVLKECKDDQRNAYCIVSTEFHPFFVGGVTNFRLHFLSHFSFNFENLSAHLVANILNFPKHPQLMHFVCF